jgi:hypothetical protein
VEDKEYDYTISAGLWLFVLLFAAYFLGGWVEAWLLIFALYLLANVVDKVLPPQSRARSVVWLVWAVGVVVWLVTGYIACLLGRCGWLLG